MSRDDLNKLMESASVALARMDYLAAERMCLEALSAARDQRLWSDYARILLPLQECRRQRRIIAADGPIRLGTSDLTPISDPVAPMQGRSAGCILLTEPFTAEHALALHRHALEHRLHVEVLLARRATDPARWRIESFHATKVHVDLPGPPGRMPDRWLDVADADRAQAAGYFLAAAEALGDAAISAVGSPPGTSRRLADLERCLDVVLDHEILHQRLWDAAHALAASPTHA
ncbi:MAG: hypothetical protein IT442_17135 [Phycisphaeraceae bacterium]|nr:hypothetical protein [Phycisphaeraceae bacterium]